MSKPTEPAVQIIPAPAAPQVNISTGQQLRPEDYNSDLATAKMAEKLVSVMGFPAIYSKEFAVRQGIFEALNHAEINPTGYDCSLRVAIYRNVERKSVNIDGKYFNSLWAYLNKPKYIINQNAPPQDNAFNKEPGFIQRAVNRLTGKGGDNANQSNAR
jgi:hypothetical protein